MALKVTRLTFAPSLRSLARACCKCHEIASPSRSGSVARIKVWSVFNASVMARKCFLLSAATSHFMAKLSSVSTEPSLGGKSRTWPNEAKTTYPSPKYLFIVLALAGDSTTTTAMKTPLHRPNMRRRKMAFKRPLCQCTFTRRRLSNF